MTNDGQDPLIMPPPPTVPQLRRPIRPEDVASVASDSSVYAGIGDAVTVALRGLRKTMKAKRDEYVAVLKEADKMDDDEFDDSKPDIDATRQRLWSATWRYVNQSRTYADAEKSRDVDKATSMLTAAQSSLVEIRALWEKTSFFDKNTFAAKIVCEQLRAARTSRGARIGTLALSTSCSQLVTVSL